MVNSWRQALSWIRSRILIVILVLIGTTAAQAELRYLETEHLRLIYFGGLHSFIAPHVVRCFENSYRFHRELWNYDLREKVTVFLHDLGDQGNAGAKNIPSNLIMAGIAPFNYAFETMSANERMNTIMNHELVHLYATDRTAGRERFFRALLWGKPEPIADHPITIFYDYLTSPRRSAPRWYHEGIAVFLETWMAGGYGRALGAYDEMVFRTMVRDSAFFYDPVGVESEGSKVDFHVGVNSYLYGTRFFSHLARQYGPEKAIQWVSRTDTSNAYYASQFHRVFGISLDDEWQQWIKKEKDFQEQNLAAIRQYPTTPFRDLAAEPLGGVSRAFFDAADRKLYVAVSHPGDIAALIAIDVDDGTMENLCDIKGPALFYVCSAAYDSSTQTLFYTTDNYGWRDIKAINTRTRASRMLLKDARIGDLAFNSADRSLWGVRHFNGMSTVVRIPHPYSEWHTVHVWPYGQDIYDLDLSPDGRWLAASLAEVSGRQTLILMDVDRLLAGDTSHSELYDFGNTIPQSFVFSGDGRHLYGSSYYTGVSNIFRYDLAADSMEILSNSETGFFRPIPTASDSLIVFRYSAKGFVPSLIAPVPLEDVNAITYLGQTIVDEHPIVKQWLAGSPGTIDPDTMIVKEGRYNPLASWQLGSMYPVVEGYKSSTAIGMRLNFSDRLGLQEADLTVSVTPETRLPTDERWHVRGHYAYSNFGLSFAYNGADFYDLVGPTKTSRKGYSVGLDYDKTLIYDDPRSLNWSLALTQYGDLERLPDYQNVATSFDEFLTFATDLVYNNRTASLGAVSHEKGHRWQLSATATYVREQLYPQIIGRLDLGTPLPFHHSSVWLHTAAGLATADRDEPFANFYFGGFGNNWVDHRTIARYSQWYSFPGLALNEIAGTNFAKATLEWKLPALHFRRVGFSALYLTWARFALFSSGLITNIDAVDVQHVAASAGAQMDVRIRLLSQFKLTLSLGFARAAEKRRRATDEFMISLKVL